MEVDGPMVQKVVVVIEVFGGKKEEREKGEGEEGEGNGDSVLEFLLKLQKEQDLMKGYVHAPFRDVIDGLDDNNNNNTKNTTNSNDARNATADAKTTLSISRRQISNWLPPPPSSSHHQNHHLSKIQQISRTDCGLLWNYHPHPPTKIITTQKITPTTLRMMKMKMQ